MGVGDGDGIGDGDGLGDGLGDGSTLCEETGGSRKQKAGSRRQNATSRRRKVGVVAWNFASILLLYFFR
jgi:hypothetical protein